MQTSRREPTCRKGNMRCIRLVAALAAAATLGLGLAACAPPDSYVALGDSYTSGPAIPVQQTNPTGCLRSNQNYPHLTARHTGLPAFRDVSCSGATTADMFAAQDV